MNEKKKWIEISDQARLILSNWDKIDYVSIDAYYELQEDLLIFFNNMNKHKEHLDNDFLEETRTLIKNLKYKKNAFFIGLDRTVGFGGAKEIIIDDTEYIKYGKELYKLKSILNSSEYIE